MVVIYDKETRRVLITEMDGIWTMPNEWEIAEHPIDADVFTDIDGEVYLKPPILN